MRQNTVFTCRTATAATSSGRWYPSGGGAGIGIGVVLGGSVGCGSGGCGCGTGTGTGAGTGSGFGTGAVTGGRTWMPGTRGAPSLVSGRPSPSR